MTDNSQYTFIPTEAETKFILEGIKSIERDGTISHDEALKRLQKRFPDIHELIKLTLKNEEERGK